LDRLGSHLRAHDQVLGVHYRGCPALRRQLGRDCSNSSQSPSQDGPAARAVKKASRREARRARPQGGQKGHPGASLAWAARPDETRVIEPGTCGGCGSDLADATGQVARAVQVLDSRRPR
jgi:transposase